MRIQPVQGAALDDILQYVQQNPTPWTPLHSISTVRRILTELISSNVMIFDFHDDQGRVLCGALIDKINNPANDAVLEILGMRASIDPLRALSEILKIAKHQLWSQRSGFQLVISDKATTHLEPCLLGQGLREYYVSVEMENTAIQAEGIPEKANIVAATKSDVDSVYNILCEAFRNNPETSIPEAKDWGPKFLSNPASHIFLWRKAGRAVGFVNLVEATDQQLCEIRTICVLPQNHGSGVGGALLKHALNETLRLGFRKCQLSVAVANEKALGLYLRSGFKVVEKYKCYRWSSVES